MSSLESRQRRLVYTIRRRRLHSRRRTGRFVRCGVLGTVERDRVHWALARRRGAVERPHAGGAPCTVPAADDRPEPRQLLRNFRVAESVKGVDPAVERFRPFHTETRRHRVWGLRGRHIAMLWCRDKENTWENELVRGKSPKIIS